MNSIAKKTLKAFCISFLFLVQVYAQGDYYNQCCNPCDVCCNPCDDCDCCNRFWVDAEYILWKIKDARVHADRGHNNFDSQHRSHKKTLDSDWRSGARFTVGYLFDEQCCYGAEASYFFLPDNSRSKCFGEDNSSGDFRRKLRFTNRMQGAEVNGLAYLCSDCSWNLRGLVGFRWWNFYEKFNFHRRFDSGSSEFSRHRFHTDNNFYGGQVGVKFNYDCNCFFFEGTGKVALGAMDEYAKNRRHFNNFDGFSSRRHHKNRERTEFAVIPEVDLNVGYRLSDCLDIKLGYTFIYVDNLARPENRNRNHSTFGSSGERSKFLKNDDLWVQGLNVGIDYRF